MAYEKSAPKAKSGLANTLTKFKKAGKFKLFKKAGKGGK